MEAAQSAARREREKATALAAEKAILVSAEGRASAEATELTKEKFRLAATLEANSKLSQQQLEVRRALSALLAMPYCQPECI